MDHIEAGESIGKLVKFPGDAEIIEAAGSLAR